MNRVIILESLLALAAAAVLGPGTSLLVRESIRQAFALAPHRRNGIRIFGISAKGISGH